MAPGPPELREPVQKQHQRAVPALRDVEPGPVRADRPVRPGARDVDSGVAVRGHGYPALAAVLALLAGLRRRSSDTPSARLRLVLLMPVSLRTIRHATRAAMTISSRQVRATHRKAPQ